MTSLPRHLLSDNASVDSKGMLSVAGCQVSDLVEEFGSPLFVYDEDHIRSRCREAVEAFGSHATYASKVFLTKAVAKLVYEEGMGIDVSSGGEIHVCLSAGVPADRLTFHGNNKSVEELKMGIAAGVNRIVVDSFDEIERLEKIYDSSFSAPNILLRVTPGIKAETHKYISTGQDDSKFGFTVSTGDAKLAVEKAMASPAMNLMGIHAHIGSQVLKVDSFAKAVEVLADFARPFDLPELVVGGGLGVAYVIGDEAPTISQWAKTIKDAAKECGVTAALGIEPGRAIVAAAGMTVYKVGTIKKIDGVRNYVAVDGGMSDNPRPVLYGSGYEAFDPNNVMDERTLTANVVGKHCESGDILVEDAQLPQNISVGDLLATPVTGAYGYSMSSNYNAVPRCAVVFVKDGVPRLVRRRETYDDLLLTELG